MAGVSHDHGEGHTHDHRHDHGHDHDRDQGQEHGHGHDHRGVGERRLLIVIGLNVVLAVAQVIGGLAFGSVALLADTIHQAVDVVGLTASLVALRLLRRGPSPQRSFGWGRADAIGAGVSGLILLASTAWLLVEAVSRLADPTTVDGGPVALLGLFGVAVNGGCALLLSGGTHLSQRAARLHLFTDAGGSAAVVVAGVVVAVTGWNRVDPLVSIGLSVVVVWATWGLLRRAGQVLTDATPAGLAPEAITAVMKGVAGVTDVHHLHVWSLGPDDVAVSAHLLVDGERTVHEAQVLTAHVEDALRDRFGVSHLTVQVECHPCEAPDH